MKRIITEILCKRWNIHYASLPYNLNWLINLGIDEQKFLSNHPIIVCDVGCRNCAPKELIPFYPYIEYHGFDADKEECSVLKKRKTNFRRVSLFPYVIYKNMKQINFNLFFIREHSSIYKPCERFKNLFGGTKFRIEKIDTTNSISLDYLYESEALNMPDFLKLDTQGSELEILRNCPKILNHINLVELEVEFTEIYKNQPLFHHVSTFMYENGFELLFLNRVFAQRTQIYSGPSRGQIVYADALFGRREDYLYHFDYIRLIKYILLLINYGHIDLAFHITKKYPEASELLPSIKRHFSKKSHGSFLKRYFFSQLDKIVALYLFSRKYNQCDMDSDRSWPIR